eukprot:COSAG06_NODE_5808_length_3262_cov_1.917800_4_plen_40_part_01
MLVTLTWASRVRNKSLLVVYSEWLSFDSLRSTHLDSMESA